MNWAKWTDTKKNSFNWLFLHVSQNKLIKVDRLKKRCEEIKNIWTIWRSKTYLLARRKMLNDFVRKICWTKQRERVSHLHSLSIRIHLRKRYEMIDDRDRHIHWLQKEKKRIIQTVFRPKFSLTPTIRNGERIGRKIENYGRIQTIAYQRCAVRIQPINCAVKGECLLSSIVIGE